MMFLKNQNILIIIHGIIILSDTYILQETALLNYERAYGNSCPPFKKSKLAANIRGL